MFNKIVQRRWLSLPIVLSVVGTTVKVVAQDKANTSTLALESLERYPPLTGKMHLQQRVSLSTLPLLRFWGYVVWVTFYESLAEVRGRLRNAQGDNQGAIAKYTQAVDTLQSLRSDLVTISSDVQFSFRESVEPVYRELVGLLLQPKAENASQINLAQARKVIESLQLAELDNFFRDACITAKPVQIDEIDKTAAVLYPIILPDRLEVILALPGQPLRQYTTALPKQKVNTILQNLRDAATNAVSRVARRRFLEPAQQVYNWLIRPAEAELAASGVKTLAIVPDGAFRNIPLSALYDGKQYLIENYSVAIAPGLQLVDPQPLTRQKLQFIGFGLSEARQG